MKVVVLKMDVVCDCVECFLLKSMVASSVAIINSGKIMSGCL